MILSNQLYKDLLSKMEEDILTVFDIEISENTKELLKSAKRIFVTGSGSSFPAAYFASHYLNKNTNSNIILANSSDILDSKSLNENDLVVLVSQGWGRADAYLITQKCIETSTRLIALTGHPERLGTHYPQADLGKIIPVEIKPNQEKIFCRPNSPLTSLIQISRLFEIHIDQDQVINVFNQIKQINFQNVVDNILQFKNIVILSSSTSLSACYNLALALREGSGKHTDIYEIETYGHGWYTIDQENKDETLYILVSHKSQSHTLEAYNRIEKLIRNTNSNYVDICSDCDEIYGNVYLLIFTAFLIPKLNDVTDFDMNQPKGMEENRSFHEIFEQTK